MVSAMLYLVSTAFVFRKLACGRRQSKLNRDDGDRNMLSL